MGDDRVYSKRDWVFVNKDWHDSFNICNNSYNNNNAILVHCYMLVKSVSPEDKGTKPFHFFNIWIDHPGYKNLISSIWDINVSGSAFQRVVK